MKNLLVIGAGLIGIRHVRHIKSKSNCRLAGIVEPNKNIAEEFGVPIFASIDEVDVEVDGAVIATPTGLHLDHAEQCAKRGWDMLIEKPITETIDQAEKLVEIVKRTGVKTLIGHHRRYHQSVAALKKLIESGKIGSPVTATAVWAVKKPDDYFNGNWREGPHGSPVLINLVHDIDLLRFVLGEVVEVTGLGVASVRKAERVESGAVVMKFEKGCVAAISFTDTAPSPWGFEAGTGENPNIGTTGQDMLWITGTMGGVSFPSMTVWSGASDWSDSAKSQVLSVNKTTPLIAQIDHFCDLMDNKCLPMISAADGKETLNVALQAQAILAESLITS